MRCADIKLLKGDNATAAKHAREAPEEVEMRQHEPPKAFFNRHLGRIAECERDIPEACPPRSLLSILDSCGRSVDPDHLSIRPERTRTETPHPQPHYHIEPAYLVTYQPAEASGV